MLSTKRQKRNSITVMGLMPTSGFGITLADMKSPKASPIPIQSKQTMQNYDIIWLAWLASPAVSHGARMPSAVLFGCSPSVTTADNSTNNAIQTIPPISWTSLAHYISHSLEAENTPKIAKTDMIALRILANLLSTPQFYPLCLGFAKYTIPKLIDNIA